MFGSTLRRVCHVGDRRRVPAATDVGKTRAPALHDAAAALTYNRMVVGGLADEEVDRLFHALADATRRDILHRCIEAEPSVSRLADGYPMSFAAVQKHVAVLERAGLVVKERRGREQLVRTDHDAVGRARVVLDELETAWRGRVDRMADLLAQVPRPSAGRSG
jgi:DNA-binding transcriptional ArsR family regulator